MKKTAVCILFGGRSGEHEVSLRSAASVARNLERKKYDLLLVGIDPRGLWFLQEQARFSSHPQQGESLVLQEGGQPVTVVPGQGLYVAGRKLELEVAFPVLHGSFGEDGTVQGLLEIAGIPYVGAGVLASALAMDKEKTKKLWQQAGLPVVDFVVLREPSEQVPEQIRRTFGFPVFVKPATLGSSVGISKVRCAGDLAGALEQAFRFDTKVMIEPAVAGREIECSVIGDERPEAFDPGEIIPSHEFYSYEAKYLDPQGARLMVPADLPPALRLEFRRLAVEAFRAVECSGMARVDFFLEKGSQRILLNEINTIPGFTNISMYPKLCEAGGLSYPRLLDRLIELALERYARRQALRYSRG